MAEKDKNMEIAVFRFASSPSSSPGFAWNLGKNRNCLERRHLGPIEYPIRSASVSTLV